MVTLGATAMVVSDASGRGNDPMPMVLLACTMVGVGAVAAAIFTWRFAGLRATRIETQPVDAALSSDATERPTRARAPGLARYAIYLTSAILWPVGLVAAVLYSKPENVRVGAVALRISVAQLTVIALAVCIGLPFVISMITAP